MQGVSRLCQEEASASMPGIAQEQACNDQLDPCSQQSTDTAAKISTVPLQKDHATEIQSSLQTQVLSLTATTPTPQTCLTADASLAQVLTHPAWVEGCCSMVSADLQADSRGDYHSTYAFERTVECCTCCMDILVTLAAHSIACILHSKASV